MQVLMLGNGFDLNYKLPTKYINFLNTINYIADNIQIDFRTIGDVFGAKELRALDEHIAKSYQMYSVQYDATPLPSEVIKKFRYIKQTNIWYSFLWNSLNKDIGWIDFECQINTVITAFKDFLNGCKSTFDIQTHPKQPLSRHIIRQFDYFLRVEGKRVYSIRDEYILENPIGSQIYEINIDKLIGNLKKSLDEFTEMLRIYLYYFVEQPMLRIPSFLKKDEWFVKLQPEYVVTFNYTSTFEHFCTSARVAHIHGKVDDKIVLGVNPNEDDEVNTADTMFIEFKKYLQRITLGTDTEYRLIADELDDGANDLLLTVMGHSLDVTDEDIIRELFDYASDIAIIYHSPNALKDCVAKLVALYGKDELDVMRREKNLRFISINKDLDSYVESVKLREIAPLYL